MENNKRTIAIVCGGDSSEHDVSLACTLSLIKSAITYTLWM